MWPDVATGGLRVRHGQALLPYFGLLQRMRLWCNLREDLTAKRNKTIKEEAPMSGSWLSDRLDDLRISRSGQFLARTRDLSDKELEDAFTGAIDLFINAWPLAEEDKPFWPQHAPGWPTQPEGWLALRARTVGGSAGAPKVVASVAARPGVRPPLFAPESNALFEVRFAFIVLLEITTAAGQRYFFVHRELAQNPLDSLLDAWQPVEMPNLVEPFYSATAGSRLERLSMRKIASTRQEVQRKIVEAYDVEAATSSLGLHRVIPGSMQIVMADRSIGRRLNISPFRSSVRAGSERVALSDLMTWAGQCALALESKTATTQLTSSFLSGMARPVESLLVLIPSTLVFDITAVEEVLTTLRGENVTWIPDKAGPQTEPELLDSLSTEIQIAGTALDKSGTPVKDKSKATEVFFGALKSAAVTRVRVTKSTFSVDLDPRLGGLVTADKSPRSLSKALSEARAFRAVLDGGQVLFSAEGAFRTSNMTLAVAQLSDILKPVKALDVVTSEKGIVNTGDTSFQTQSSFSVIETAIAHQHEVLICDDARDEWCDYLGISAESLSWYHAKVALAKDPKAPTGATSYLPVTRSDSLSASGLQEVIGQAVKNLARLRVNNGEHGFSSRVKRWATEKCTLPAPGAITRLRKPTSGLTAAEIEARIAKVSLSPVARLEVCLVVPNYSRAELTAGFRKIGTKTPPPQTVLQAFWLLSGFMHSCLEVGATPKVYVRE